MNEAARRTVQHPHATAQIEETLSTSPAGAVYVEAMATTTGLPVNLVSTIMGRLARQGMRYGALTRPEGNPSGVFAWDPQGRAQPALAVVHRQRRPIPRAQPRRSVCPDSALSSPTEHPQPSVDGSWVFFGETTGRPYRVVPL